MVALDLVRAIPRHDYHQTFVCFSGRRGTLAEEFERAGATVRVVSGRSALARLLDLRRQMARLKPDVVVSHVSLASGTVLAAAWTAKVRTRIARFHSQGDGRGRTAARRLYRAVSRIAVRWFATKSVGVTAVALLFGTGRGVTDGSRFEVLGNGVDTDRFALREVNTDGVVRVLHVGRASPEKNRRMLVPIYHAMSQIVHTTWTVVGPGPTADLGPVPQDGFAVLGDSNDIAAIMRAHDVLVLPSIWEGLPGVILEAASSGLPTVASDISSINELAHRLIGLTTHSVDASPASWARALDAAAAFGSDNSLEIRQTLLRSSYTLGKNVVEWRRLFDGD